MWLILIPIIIAIIIVAIYIILRKLGGAHFPWIQFYTKGKESGFNFKEINLLRRCAVENKLQEPTSLFWSVKQLDRSIKGIILKFRSTDSEGTEDNIDFISKLFDFRKRVELNLPKYKVGIKSSKEIIKHQRVKITLAGSLPYYAVVVEVLKKYIALSYPRGPKLPPGFSWQGRKIGVYFWRQDDAGYFLQSKVIGDFSAQKYPIIHIAHSDNLIRTQKRKSVRIETNLSTLLYPLKNINMADEVIEETQGLRCKLINLSEDGAAILIGGQAKTGLAIKIQFTPVDNTVVMSGVVRGVNYNQAKNRSILHMQAVVPSAKTKNHILSYVYNIMGERSNEIYKTPDVTPQITTAPEE